MEIFLTTNCASLSGTIDRRQGYYIRRSKTGHFFAQRSKHSVPRQGHLNFIFLCAHMACIKLCISNIRVHRDEVLTALREAGKGDYLWALRYPKYLSANDVLTLQSELGL